MTKSCQKVEDAKTGCAFANSDDFNASQSLPLPLVTVVHAARQAVASAAPVPRTITLCGPPVRIPVLPVVPVEAAASASEVQSDVQEQASVSPKPPEPNHRPPARSDARDGRKTPQRWGRYETLCEIGRGGMGTVYLCRSVGDAGFRRLCAVKALRADLSRDPLHSRFFLEQARIAARLHHPNIVSTLDVGVRDGQPYLAMDYVEGVSLSGLLDKDRSGRSPRLLVPIILDALRGLRAAHELVDDRGELLELVHCDISPQNLLVGSDGVGRITDFGVARARGLQPEGIRGKPGFLSPEQLIGENIDRRSDLFSLGTLMWCALTGEQLFHGSSLEATLTNVIRRKIAPPSSVGLKPPACLDAIVLKALERDPEHRFQTAAEMLEALHAVAVENDFLATTSTIGAWVEKTFGHELERRKHALLEGGPSPAALVRQRSDGDAENAAALDLSSTQALPKPSRQKKLLALVIVLVSLIALGISVLLSPAITHRLWILPARNPSAEVLAPSAAPKQAIPRDVGPAFTRDAP